jgi:acetyl esterase/lipase
MPTNKDLLDWRHMEREALGRAFNNAAAVPNSDAIIRDWEARSAALRVKRSGFLDLRYGPRERNRIDFFSAGEHTPTLVFIHGGYWQARSKETFTFVAEGPLAMGVSVALIGYTLAPETTIDRMVEEIGSALDYLDVKLPAIGGDPGKVWISGWSAGAHLATMQIGHKLVRGGLVVSGLYDLRPLQHCYINDKLGMDSETAFRNSCILNLPPASPPLTIVVGTDELQHVRLQSSAFATARAAKGLPGKFHELSNSNHFTILEQFCHAGRLTELVRDLVID